MTERDVMEFDVVIVGGGPAGLSTAIHLKNLIERHNAEVERSGAGQPLAPEICLIEKAAELGAHSLSGAVMDPKGLDALLPGWRTMEPKAPVEARSTRLCDVATEKGGMKFLTSPAVEEPRQLRGLLEQDGSGSAPSPRRRASRCSRIPGASCARRQPVTGVQLGDRGRQARQVEGQPQPGGIPWAACWPRAARLADQAADGPEAEGKNPQVTASAPKSGPAGQCPASSCTRWLPTRQQDVWRRLDHGMGHRGQEHGLGRSRGRARSDPTMDGIASCSA
jgi:hypothetical protein